MALDQTTDEKFNRALEQALKTVGLLVAGTEKIAKNMKAAGSSAGNIGGAAGGGSLRVGGDSPTFGGTTQSIASMGIGKASFGGTPNGPSTPTTDGAPANGGGSSNVRAGSLAIAGATLSVANAAWKATPSLSDAFTHQNLMYQASLGMSGSMNTGSVWAKMKQNFAGAFTSKFGAQEAGVMLNMSGFGPNSAMSTNMQQQSAGLSKLTGMTNTESASAMVGLNGGAGATGKLSQYGIFTTNPTSGKSAGLGGVIDQLWARWYGSSSAKVDPIKFEADLAGGYLGQDLRYFFGDQPQLYMAVLQGLKLKVNAGGMSGINFANGAKGPKSVSALMKKQGINTTNNPMLTAMGMNSSAANAMGAMSDPLIAGMNSAAGGVNAVNDLMASLGDNGLAQAALKAKGALETFATSSTVMSGLNLAMTALTATVSRLAFQGALGGTGGGLLGGMGGAGKVLGGIGKIGAAGAAAGLSVMGGDMVRNKLRDSGIAEKGSALDKWGTTLATAGTYAAAGAILGTAVPGLGTAVGAGVGAVIGTGVGLWQGLTSSNNAGGGSSTSDSVHARLSKGEYVINARAAQQIGKSNLDALNSSGHGLGSAYASPAKMLAAGGSVDGQQVVNYAKQFIGVKYVDHSTNPGGAYNPQLGWDCSSFTSYVYKNFGVNLTPYSDTQYAGGTEVPRNQLQPGDLLFFHNQYSGDKVTGHVGIYGGADKMIHAAGKDSGTIESGIDWKTYKGARRYGLSGDAALGVAPPVSAGTSSDAELPVGDLVGYTPPANMLTSRSGMLNPMSTFMKSTDAQYTGVYGKALLDASTKAVGSKPKSQIPDPSTAASMPAGKGGAWLAQYLYSKGLRGANLKSMWAIGMRESRGNPLSTNSHNQDGSKDYGLFQINDKAHSGYLAKHGQTMQDMLDPSQNVDMMMHMTQGGNNLSAWGVANSDGSVTGWAKSLGAKTRAKFQAGMDKQAAQFDKYAAKAGVPGASAGMRNVEADQNMRVHTGEMILPAYASQQFRESLQEVLSGGGGRSGDVNINVSIASASHEETMRLVQILKKELKHDATLDRMRTR